MGNVEIIVSIIEAVALIAVAIINKVNGKKIDKSRQENKMHSAKQSILQLMLEDKLAVLEGKLPENYKDISIEFDDYIANYGNSYMHRKMDDYEAWYKDVTDKLSKNINKPKTTRSKKGIK